MYPGKLRLTQHKRFAIAHPNFCFAKTSFMLGTLYDIPSVSKGIIFEGFSWQRENFLNTRMYISIMIHKEVGTWQIKE